MADSDADLRYLENEDMSVWAERTLPPALELAVQSVPLTGRYDEALDYLRNWDFRYHRASIGASIFDGWMRFVPTKTGELPSISIPEDSLERSVLAEELARGLTRAVDSLAAEAGPDLARWRLERFRSGTRVFPVWSFEPIRDELPGLGDSRYAPIDLPRDGHPTTLQWQPGIKDYPANAPSHVLLSGVVGRPDWLSIRPDYRMGTGFIARYIASLPDDRHARGPVIHRVALKPQD